MNMSKEDMLEKYNAEPDKSKKRLLQLLADLNGTTPLHIQKYMGVTFVPIKRKQWKYAEAKPIITTKLYEGIPLDVLAKEMRINKLTVYSIHKELKETDSGYLATRLYNRESRKAEMTQNA